jgi:glycosyltransferase involved in cell wall biosynthesis
MPGLNLLTLNIGPKLSRRSALDMAIRFPLHRLVLERYLREWIHKYELDIVHLQYKKEQIIASSLAAELGAAVVWTEHDRLPKPLVRLWPALQLYRIASRHANRIVCVAEFVKSNMISHGLSERMLVVCHNGIDPMSSASDARVHLKNEFGFAPEDLVIATASRLAWTKGIEYLLQAAASVLHKLPEARFLIMGDGPERKALQDKAHRLGIFERVAFTGYRPDVPALLDIVDVFACPSIQEGFPFSVLEAMRAGKPVVATRTGGIPELVRHGVDGVLIDVGDVRGLAEAITQLLVDSHLRARLGQSGRTRVIDNFSTAAMVDCTESVFLDALVVHNQWPQRQL